MNKRDKIIDSFKNDEDKTFTARLIDCIEQAQRSFEPKFTQFLDPAQVCKAERIISQFHEVRYLVSCGVYGCERNIIAIFPEDFDEEKLQLPLSGLCVLYKSKFENISHRDVLGALMGIGIKREKTGDIIINEDKCYIICCNDISYYIIMNLNMIKHTSVKAEYIDFDKIERVQDNYREIVSSIASMRLDSILSCGYGESRSSIVHEITRGNVKVNWEEILTPSHVINEGDTVSLKGRGRIKVEKVEGVTRKGRVRVVIKRMI